MAKNILRRYQRPLRWHVFGMRLAIALMLFFFVASRADAQGNVTRWTGGSSDDWLDGGNWNNGIPEIAFTTSLRASIESATDLANWPIIKSGQTVTTNQRVWLPEAPLIAEPMTYGRLTIASGGTLNVNHDFRAAEGNSSGPPDTPAQYITASLNVAGTLNLHNRSRFGDSDYTTIDVDVTGIMIHDDPEQDFDIGGGTESSADFDISGQGLVSVTGDFGVFEGSLLSLSDDGKLTLNEYEYVVAEDEFGNPIETATFTKAEIIAQVQGFVALGVFEGLTDTYSGSETLIGLGNGLAYYEGAASVSFVAADIPPPVTGDGDYNDDGLYDILDYVLWRIENGPPEDYEAWSSSYGLISEGTSGVRVSNAVPECSALGMLACAGAIASLLRRGERRSRRAPN